MRALERPTNLDVRVGAPADGLWRSSMARNLTSARFGISAMPPGSIRRGQRGRFGRVQAAGYRRTRLPLYTIEASNGSGRLQIDGTLR